MPKLTVDEIAVEVPAGATVMQACEVAGVEIPRFCYHERLSIAGNCRMCLVEQEKAPKPIASCAMPATENMVIRTNTPKVKKAREGVMAFLLINHPLDCPICDQGGECDLQDQAMAYGRGYTRFHENKRAVTEKHMGPLIKTVMTRCIHCTRCVRFAEEVAGVEEIGALFRGENMQITSYLEKAVTSEVSGNVIDLCPVGALTSKPYAFTARPWELTRTESVDVHDAVGSNIIIGARGNQVMRVTPRLNDQVNEEWLTDKARFAADGLMKRRLDRPYVREDGRLAPVSWAYAFGAIKAGLAGLTGDQIGALAGDLAAVEEMVAVKDLLAKLGSANHECRVDGTLLDAASGRAGYLFNTTLSGIEQADAVLLVGANPRWEAPLVNTRIRKAVRKRRAAVFAIGDEVDLTYPAAWLGNDIGLLGHLPAHVTDALAAAKRPAAIVGVGALALWPGALAAAAALLPVRDGWAGLNVLHTGAARVGGLDVGFIRNGGLDRFRYDLRTGKLKAVINLGADEIDQRDFEAPFTVYIGTHGDAGVRHADVILPAAAYTEKAGTYVNMEGRVQRARRAVHPPGEARVDWTILRALSDVLEVTLPYDDERALAQRIAGEWPHLAREEPPAAGPLPSLAAPDAAPSGEIALPIRDYYWTNPIARASDTMRQCREQILGLGLREAAE